MAISATWQGRGFGLAMASFVVTFCSSLVWAQDFDAGPEEREQENRQVRSLQDFFKLTEQLPRAICDESALARPPSINLNPPDAIYSRRIFHSKATFDEAKVISFLLEDSLSLLGAKEIVQKWSKQSSPSATALIALKRETAKDVCTAVVSTGKLEELSKVRSDLFLTVSPSSAGTGDKSGFYLRDIDQRFGQIGQSWHLAGWIEPYEVESFVAEGRAYHRMAHPVTNQLESIQIVSPEGFPIAHLFPTSEPVQMDWQNLESRSVSNDSRRRKIATYRLMIELSAFAALQSKPDKVDSIRKHQEFYKSLLSAYEIYPDDERFKKIGQDQKSLRIPSSKDVRRILDAQFFEKLKKARVNGAYVALHYLPPDSRLQGIYREFKAKLEEMVRQ